MNLLIVDDEPLACERLQKLVQELYTDSTIFAAHNGLDALDKISTYSPEIVLLDIRMPSMDGIELANHLLHLEQPPAIVFTSAYADHAISAFDANAVDYLLKPIRKERLKTAIERATIVNQATLQAIAATQHTTTRRKHLSTVSQGKLQLIPIDNIYYLKAEQKYVMAIWSEGETLIDETLISLETEFQDYFMRIHRNTLVAINHIDSLCKKDGKRHVIKLISIPVELTISRRHLPEIRAIIKQR